MGHSVIYCDFCGNSVMEGHGDWECDRCHATCDGSVWVKAVKKKMEVVPTEVMVADTTKKRL